MLTHFLTRIAEKSRDFGAAPVIIAAIGDSVTQGCMDYDGQRDVIDQEGVYHHYVWRGLIKRFPACTFSVINAGFAGDTAPGGLRRFERDVGRHAPDLVLIGYCLNDAGAGVEKLPDYRRDLAALISRSHDCGGDAIVLTPNFVCTRSSHRVAAKHRAAGYIDFLTGVQTSGTLARYAQAAREVAAELQAPVADVYARWEELAARGIDTTDMLSNGLNHPTPEAHRIHSELVLEIIDEAAAANAGKS